MKNETILLMRKGLLDRVLYVLLALLLPALTNAQGWNRLYDLGDNLRPIGAPMELITAANGNYFGVGSAELISTGEIANYIMKINGSGDVLWIEYAESETTIYEAGNLSDGYYLMDHVGTVQKFDEDGNIVWENESTTSLVFDYVAVNEMGGVYKVEYGAGGGGSTVFLKEIDSNGNTINGMDITNNINLGNMYVTGVLRMNDGNLLLIGRQFSTGNHHPFFKAITTQGELLWEQYYTSINGVVRNHKQLADGRLVFLGDNAQGGVILFETDQQGNLLSNNNFPDIQDFPAELIDNNDGSYSFVGSTFEDGLYVRYYQVTNTGDILQTVAYNMPDLYWQQYVINMVPTETGGYLFSNSASAIGDTTDMTYVLWRTDANGDIFANQLKGNVYHDLNTDCLPDAGEMGLAGWIVYADGEDDFYAVTDANGDYLMEVDTGDYDLELIYPLPYWQACINPYSFSVALGDTVVSDFPTQSLTDCPGMYVDISTPVVRHCMDAYYYVHYCNYGTQDATDVYVEVTIDPLYTYLGASITPTSIVGNVYTFDLGTVPVGVCGDFTIDVTLAESCDAIVIGQTFCMEAHIFPDSLCLPDTSGWDGSSIELTANCTGTEVIFEIINVGEDMEGAPREYIVIEDNIMFDSGLFLLASGQTEDVGFPANGSTYRLEAQQANGHPGNSMPAIVIEGCDADGDGDFSIGYYTQLPENDADPFISIDCQESTAPYDPNDKRGYPSGYDVEHFIAANQDIEYIIRFQNLGNDTAFVVIVEDQLVAELDPTTVRPGASSFPYTFQIVGDGKLVFTFDQIKLPPESTNEAGSIGFVKFRVSQRADLEEGTVINNEANIFFDFNAPILTNQTLHTVAYEFVTVSSEEVYVPGVNVNVFPNPFVEAATLEVEGYETTMYTLYIYDLAGRQLRLERHDQSTITLQRKGLAAGVYTYRLEAEGQLIGVGKIVIQ